MFNNYEYLNDVETLYADTNSPLEKLAVLFNTGQVHPSWWHFDSEEQAFWFASASYRRRALLQADVLVKAVFVMENGYAYPSIEAAKACIIYQDLVDSNANVQIAKAMFNDGFEIHLFR